ncbi:MAG TPA: hypothetical protein VD999_07745 [Vitreimonas sp.]|nr:hypothetical protein [Vitreimonas sp.]
MTIIEYLEQNTRFHPIDILGPEDCALCELEDCDDLFHICMEDGFARIEVFDEG